MGDQKQKPAKKKFEASRRNQKSKDHETKESKEAISPEKDELESSETS